MLRAIHASAPILIAVIARAFTSSRHQNTHASPHPASLPWSVRSHPPARDKPLSDASRKHTCKPPSRLASMVRAFTSCRLRNNPFMHRHLRHVHTPDAIDSMSRGSSRSFVICSRSAPRLSTLRSSEGYVRCAKVQKMDSTGSSRGAPPPAVDEEGRGRALRENSREG